MGAAFPGYIATGLIADRRRPAGLGIARRAYQGGLVVMSDDGGATWTVLARWRSSVATRALALVPGDAGGLRFSRSAATTGCGCRRRRETWTLTAT